MPTIHLQTEIKAPVQRCFDLSRSMEVHVLSMQKYHEKIVGGRMSGLIENNETVELQAKHFGITQFHSSKIIEMNAPFYFVDVMLKGSFKSLHHQHIFEEKGTFTLVKDIFYYESPLGILGKLADVLFLKKYMKNLLTKRNEFIKQMAENETYKTLLS